MSPPLDRSCVWGPIKAITVCNNVIVSLTVLVMQGQSDILTKVVNLYSVLIFSPVTDYFNEKICV